MATRTGPPIRKMSTVKAAYNLGVYGNSGVGKTVFGGSYPNSLVLAVDPGTISAARAGSQADVWDIPTWEEFEAAQKWVRAGGYKQYEWIVLDGVSMLRERCMRFILDREHQRNSARDLFIPAMPDHQAAQNMIKFAIEKFCDLAVHFLFTALPMHVESRSGDEVVVPLVHGQKGDLSHYLTGLTDAFGYMEVTENSKGKPVRRIHWAPYNEYTGKDRLGVLAPYTDNATLPQIHKLISESGSPEDRASGRPVRRTRTGTRRTGTTRARRTA